ncbi:MAG: DUF2075 domain-containing protein [Rhodospirillales bacterium]|nr:DUF2075 domain-containing protein [Rhodospirillales bacterium]
MNQIYSDAVNAWWSGSIRDFLLSTDHDIIGRLTTRQARDYRTNEPIQLQAWMWQIEKLRSELTKLPEDWRLLLEYPLLRLGRRLDAVLVSDRAIFVIEFKTLGHGFDASAREQAEDYAHDLRDFHAASRDKIIIPIVVAGSGKPVRPQFEFPFPGVSVVYEALANQLADLLTSILAKIPTHSIDITGWEAAPYRPVPTIIEAARALYDQHGVAEIKAARADTINLSRTTAAILQVIHDAKTTGTYHIVFVTGIPGAGKTLCGLDVAFSPEVEATFLTGTLPMVYVLKAALAEDRGKQKGYSQRAARHQSKAKIESVVGFLRDSTSRTQAPSEHVIIFDEAQRAWDAKKGAGKFQYPQSEAAIVLDIMRRHQDYAVIVALVGNGQEINTGEAGLAEWGRALLERPEWHVQAAPGVLNATEPKQRLFTKTVPVRFKIDPSLHLNTPIRNIRSASAATWIDAVLLGKKEVAQHIASAELPIYLTRSLETMRRHLRLRARGGRRAGLVCSSGAKRLVADGLWPKFPHQDEKAVANWFLKKWPDVRACDALELPATEFACQGLELDYVGLCWGGDLIWTGQWLSRSFRGKKWQHPKDEEMQAYTINTYRVLLTRARADTIIWIPEGDLADQTRRPDELDATAAFLLSCGAQIINENVEPAIV